MLRYAYYSMNDRGCSILVQGMQSRKSPRGGIPRPDAKHRGAYAMFLFLILFCFLACKIEGKGLGPPVPLSSFDKCMQGLGRQEAVNLTV